MTFAGAQGATALAVGAGKFCEPVSLGVARIRCLLAGQITVVPRFHFAAIAFLHVATPANPIAAMRRQTLLHVSWKIHISPRPAGVIDTDRVIGLDLSIESFRRM